MKITNKMLQPVIGFLKKEDGPTAVECALLLGLIIVICLVAIHTAQMPQDRSMEPRVVNLSNQSG